MIFIVFYIVPNAVIYKNKSQFYLYFNNKINKNLKDTFEKKLMIPGYTFQNKLPKTPNQDFFAAEAFWRFPQLTKLTSKKNP